jgi:hypothetical protein
MPKEPIATTQDLKELKCLIPVEHVLRLHHAKLETGKPISEIVTEALSAYFGDDDAHRHR